MSASVSSGGAPRVWLLLGHKPGDNAQVRHLARALGLPFVEKQIHVRPEWETGKPRIAPRLDHVDLARSDALLEPWPDLVLASGRRLACVALWLKRASAGRTRIVMVGMPRHRGPDFDLMVVASHYVAAERANLVRHDLPLMPVDEARVVAAAADWRERFAAFPRPLTALLLGGPTGGLRFDLAVAERLLAEARADVARHGGSLFVTTSRRTPAAIVRRLESSRSEQAGLHVFDAAAPPSENPYHALLGLADHFIVTTDSLSMLVEVVRLGKPLSLFALEPVRGAFERALERIGLLRAIDPRHQPLPAGGLAARVASRLGLPIHSRDLSAIPRRLVARGLAGWLGEPRVEIAGRPADEVDAVAARVRALVAERHGGV